MTDKSNDVPSAQHAMEDTKKALPERPANHFCASKDIGIVVDVEVQLGDPVDSQIIRNFMNEFSEASGKKRV